MVAHIRLRPSFFTANFPIMKFHQIPTAEFEISAIFAVSVKTAAAAGFVLFMLRWRSA